MLSVYSAKRYERLMKAHNIQPGGNASGQAGPNSPAPAAKGKGKKAAAGVGKRKLAGNNDAVDDPEDVKPKTEDADEKKPKRARRGVKKLEEEPKLKDIDGSSIPLKMKHIPEAPLPKAPYPLPRAIAADEQAKGEIVEDENDFYVSRASPSITAAPTMPLPLLVTPTTVESKMHCLPFRKIV
jgi:hypothetical protein